MNRTPGTKPAGPRWGAGRVAFLAHLEAIRTAVEAGWPLSAIYDEHRGALGISYSNFTRYVARYVRQPGGEATATPAGPRSRGGKAGGRAVERAGGAQPQFRFDPRAVGKDDLV